MGQQVTIGGERLGSGKKMKAELHNYERSSHDLSNVWRSTMAAGTLVPFLTLVGLPGDTFDIDLNVDVLTHPTIGPLFGTYKIQLDVFQVPVRLYQAKLHMNALNIGMDMSAIMLPQIQQLAIALDRTKPLDDQQINPSCILNYLGMRGLGHRSTIGDIVRQYNAIPYLAYWDIYKQYYANKQEEIGAVIHKNLTLTEGVITEANLIGYPDTIALLLIPDEPPVYTYDVTNTDTKVEVKFAADVPDFTAAALQFRIYDSETGSTKILTGDKIFTFWEYDNTTFTATGSAPEWLERQIGWNYVTYNASTVESDKYGAPEVVTFPLKNIDDMKEEILKHFSTAAFIIDESRPAPYGLPLKFLGTNMAARYNQEGLAIKTYNSDLFNNWIATEWIDGANGIAEVTAIDTSSGSFTIDELNMSNKIYNMLNRIAISGGTYDDWLSAVYTEKRQRSAENPMYIGGKMATLVFQEVVSNAATAEDPLGTLAGRGKIGSGMKGGRIIAKIDEPSYLIGIVSLTPRIDYSQGNKWDMNLKTMNDFHKPALDEIGYQDLITDQMAWWDTYAIGGIAEFKSAGKQPAWINYMTEVNRVYGNFADQNQQMFMVLNRRYETEWTDEFTPTIKDLTTYIDPSKFNHIFADTRRDAQNFWVQIGMGIQARRKMSAKIIPNL